MVPRHVAERGYQLYQDRRVHRVQWHGDNLESELRNPSCTVQVTDIGGGELMLHCTVCGMENGSCPHQVATLMQWLDIRSTMQRMGPGTAWRSHSRHPFLAPAGTAADRVDLSHLTGSDLRSALELQLSLQRSGTSIARIIDGEVEIAVTLPSGDTRVVAFNSAVLPAALPLLRSMPRIRLEGELAQLELSEARLHPVLVAAWSDEGIVLEPGYRLGEDPVLPAAELDGRISGRWARVGPHLCLVLDPATPLVPFHRRGRQVLTGQEALRFLTLDHPQLMKHAWYVPRGRLATFRRTVVPKASGLHAHRGRGGRVVLRPSFSAGGEDLPWSVASSLLATGFMRTGEVIARAPDLGPFERCGFKLAKKAERGLLGDRLALIRVLAETDLPLQTGDEELAQLAAILRGEVLEPIASPPGLRSRLRPYQQLGVGWLFSRYLAGVGALLADDMGLGKTHQIMGLLGLIRERRGEARFLVVCPRGVLEHWHHLLTTFAPGLNPHVFHGPDRSLEGLSKGTITLVTTYDILLRSAPELVDLGWEVAVFDEAQRIKNPRTKAARASRRVQAGFRVALTGTPLENRLSELWSVIDLVLPGYLGPEREFRSRFRNPSRQQLGRLRRRLAVITLRRLKGQVLSDLPEKFEDLRYCHLTPEQRSLYTGIHRREGRVIAEQLANAGADIPYLHIFALLTRLKQVCDHPSLTGAGTSASASSGKLEVLDQLLDEALAADLQVVVFSQYVKMIEVLVQHLKRRRIVPLTLTGETRDRSHVIRRFNSGQHERVLLASLLAGGVGIDLTGASVVIHYDRWWNPAKENQATDRVHRIGQRRFVQVFKLITRGTIEERIDALIRSKLDLMEEVVAPTEDVIRTLGRRDLAELLELEGWSS